MGLSYGDASWLDDTYAFGGGDDDGLPVIVKTFKRVRAKRTLFDILIQFTEAKVVTRTVLLP